MSCLPPSILWFCGLKGHKTTKSVKCKANPARIAKDGLEAECAAAVAAAEEVEKLAPFLLLARELHDDNDADDLAAFESLGFDAIPPDSEDEFYECDTFSDDEDDEDGGRVIDLGIRRSVI